MGRIALLAATCVAAIASASAFQVPQLRQSPFFPAGIAYDAVLPAAGDFAGIREQGFNSVSLSVGWADAEPRRGSRDFTRIEQLLAAAARADLRVVVRIDMDPAPGWLLRELPEGRVRTASGSPASGAHACFDHPGVRSAEEAFIAALTRAIVSFPSLHAIDYAGAPADDAGVCFCGRTLTGFRTWLEQGYGSLTALNAAWSRRFAGWPDVAPVLDLAPRNASPAADWQTFSALRLREHLAARIRAAGDRGGRLALGHGATPALLVDASSPAGAVDDWEMGAAAEQFGALTRASGDAEAPSPEGLGLAFDGVRSAAGSKGWLLTTLAGRGNTAAAEDVRLQAWVALSRGARGLFVPPGALSATTAPLAGNLTRNAALFVPLRPRPARVALVYNRPSYVQGRRGVLQSTALFYRAAFDLNVPVDILHAGELVASGASGYDVLLLPSLLALSPPVVQSLHNFVTNRGTLIAIAAGEMSISELGTAAPMADLFGAEVVTSPIGGQTLLEMETNLEGPLSALSGRRLAGWQAREALRITSSSAAPLAHYRDQRSGNAIVTNRYGAGRAILIGAVVPHDQDAPQPDAARDEQNRLLGALMMSGGVRPEIQIDGDAVGVEARILESSDAIVIIGLNHSRNVRKVTFKFAPEMPEAIWQNMETGAAVNFLAETDGPAYSHTIAPRDVLVLMIRKALR